MKAPPGLMGTTFSLEEKENARKNRSLLFISLMTDPICNLDCPDCYVGEKNPKGSELSLDERRNILDQAKELGARTLRIAGEGEPFADKKIWGIIDHATSLGMNVFLFTNGTKIDKRVTERIGNYPNLSLVLKFSGSSEFMEHITGSKGFFTKDKFVKHDGLMIPCYIKNLIDIGFNKKDDKGNSKLGVEFLLRKSNYDYAVNIFKWCRRNNIIPYFEQNLEAGNALKWESYSLERALDGDALLLSKKLLEIDETKFGFTWKPSIPYFVGGICEDELEGCKKFTYNLVISSDGEAYPCYAAYFSLGNLRQNTLKEMLKHPIRLELLEKPNYNCLCRVYQRTVANKKVLTPYDLDKSKDYFLW